MNEQERTAIIEYLSMHNRTAIDKPHQYLELFLQYSRLTIFNMLSHIDQVLREETSHFVEKCRNNDGGYGASPGYQSSTFETYIACQIYTQLGKDFYSEETVNFIMSCYKDGSFHETKVSDQFLERNNRFNAASLGALVLLDCNRRKTMDYNLSEEFLSIIKQKGFEKEKTTKYLRSCLNGDGGFGPIPGGESHGAMCYSCLNSLNILDAIDQVDCDSIESFLVARQASSGGLNGRPYKIEDGCYGFWCLVSLDIIKKTEKINTEKLNNFLVSCFSGTGYSYRPGEHGDVFHTLYIMLGLKLLEISPDRRKEIYFGIFQPEKSEC